MIESGEEKKNMKSSKANEVECRDLSCTFKKKKKKGGWAVLHERVVHQLFSQRQLDS